MEIETRSFHMRIHLSQIIVSPAIHHAQVRKEEEPMPRGGRVGRDEVLLDTERKSFQRRNARPASSRRAPPCCRSCRSARGTPSQIGDAVSGDVGGVTGRLAAAWCWPRSRGLGSWAAAVCMRGHGAARVLVAVCIEGIASDGSQSRRHRGLP
jgi:hypothetical protein